MDDDNIDLQRQFSAAMKRNKEKLNMTAEEREKFGEAMKQPEFRSLLKEYMDEISDPKYRKEQEMYLEQLERDNQLPSEKQIIIPKPGFVTKAWKAKDSSKVFINICHSEKLDKATFKIVDDSKEGKRGVQWSLPHTLGPQRFEKDKAGEAIPTFDCCFHTDALRTAVSDQRFRELLAKTALDGVSKVLVSKEKKEDEKLGEKFHILRGISYKSGDPVTMMISRPVKTTDGNNAAKAPVEIKNSEDNVEQLKTPKYTVIHRGKFELGDHLLEKEKKLFRPKELIIKVELPTLKSAKDVDLDVSSHVFKLRAPGYGDIKAKLPYPVLDADGSAKFDKSSKTLVVTLPVQPLPSPSLAESSSRNEGPTDTDSSNSIEDLGSNQDEHTYGNEQTLTSPKETNQEQCINHHDDDKSDIIPRERTVNCTKEDVNREHGRWISNDAEPLENDEFKVVRETAEKIAKEQPNNLDNPPHQDENEDSTESTEDCLIAPFEYKQTPSAISIIVKVIHITKDSVQVDWTHKSVSISFQCDPNNQKYALGVNLNGEINECRFDVASNNMVVILTKCVSGMWEEPAVTPSDIHHQPGSTVGATTDVVTHEDINPTMIESVPPPAPIPFRNEIMYELD